MKAIEMLPQEAEAIRFGSALRRHDKKRISSWRVLGATVAGFPAFLWQLSRNHNS